MKTAFYLAFVFALMLALASASAFAAEEETGIIGSILHPIGQIEKVYDKFGLLIDGAIYLIIFLGITQVAFTKLFEAKKGGKAVSVGVSLALAFGLVLFERSAGFSLRSFGPIAGLIVVALIGYMIWVFVKSLDIGADSLTLAAIAYVAMYFTMAATFPSLISWLNEHVPVVGGLLALLALIFFVILLVKIIMLLTNLGGKKSGEEPEKPPKPEDEDKEKDEEEKKDSDKETDKDKDKDDEKKHSHPSDLGNIKAMQSRLILIRQITHKIRDEGCPAFVAALKKWVHEWNPHEGTNAKNAKDNAYAAIAVMEHGITARHESAKDYLSAVRHLARRSARDRRYRKHEKELREIRSLVEAMQRNSNFTGFTECTKYYERILRNSINDEYKHAIPHVLIHTILEGGHARHALFKKDLIETYIPGTLTEVDVILKKVMELRHKIERHS